MVTKSIAICRNRMKRCLFGVQKGVCQMSLYPFFMSKLKSFDAAPTFPYNCWRHSNDHLIPESRIRRQLQHENEPSCRECNRNPLSNHFLLRIGALAPLTAAPLQSSTHNHFEKITPLQVARKHDFVAKVAGGCSSYDVIAP